MNKPSVYHTLSIKNKIIAMVLLVVFIIMSAGFVSIATWDINQLKKTIQSNLALNTKLIGDYCVVPLYFGDKIQANEALLRLKILESVKEGYLFDKNGNLFASYPDSLMKDVFTEKFIKEKIVLIDGFFYISESIHYQGMELGTIAIKADSDVLTSKKIRLIIAFSSLMFLLLLLTYFLASKVQKNISGPILLLADQTRSISENHDFSVRLIPPGTDEIGSLYRQFNHLLAQLEKRESERDQSNKALHHLNANLEKIVQERTAMLEEANKGLEAFSYSVSHDLRAPLRHINGFLELLNRRNRNQLDEKGIHYIESISEASNKMGLLIDDLLAFSRSGRSELKMNKMDMNKAVKDALIILDPELKERKFKWTIDTLPEVFADYTMIRQVWVNLIGNAIKYTKNREVASIDIRCILNQEEQIFYVRDNGAGFDMNYAQKLFGVFQRLHSDEEFEGTGIGLANVRQVINRHKGRTWAEGEIDNGATFYFSLPL